MTYFTTWEDFAKAAEMLYVNDPMKVLYAELLITGPRGGKMWKQMCECYNE